MLLYLYTEGEPSYASFFELPEAMEEITVSDSY